MAKTNKAQARRILRDTVASMVVPALQKRGFACFRESKGNPPSWHLNRARPDGGYDVISVTLEDGYRPLFDALINVISAEGIKKPWGEFISADQATASELLERVSIAKCVFRNRTIRALARWRGIGWFGFTPRDNAAFNKEAAKAACEQFIGCLDQAEQWWRNGSLGSNLVIERIGAVHRVPDAASSSQRPQ
jgi:hypothetical protein